MTKKEINEKNIEYQYVHENGVLIGYSCRLGYIEKHYSNPQNFSSKQRIEYRIPVFEKLGLQYRFVRLCEAKTALESYYGGTK